MTARAAKVNQDGQDNHPPKTYQVLFRTARSRLDSQLTELGRPKTAWTTRKARTARTNQDNQDNQSPIP